MQLSLSTLVRVFLSSTTLLALSVQGALASQAAVKWTDTSSRESGFKIERKVTTTGTYAQIALTAANMVSFVDPTLSASTTYCYRVRAYNAGGKFGRTPMKCV